MLCVSCDPRGGGRKDLNPKRVVQAPVLSTRRVQGAFLEPSRSCCCFILEILWHKAFTRRLPRYGDAQCLGVR